MHALISSLRLPATRNCLLPALVCAALMHAPAQAQVEVGKASVMRQLVPAETLENSATQQYQELLQKAKAQGALADASNPQLQRLRGIAQRLIPYAAQWNPRASQWPVRCM